MTDSTILTVLFSIVAAIIATLTGLIGGFAYFVWLIAGDKYNSFFAVFMDNTICVLCFVCTNIL